VKQIINYFVKIKNLCANKIVGSKLQLFLKTIWVYIAIVGSIEVFKIESHKNYICIAYN